MLGDISGLNGLELNCVGSAFAVEGGRVEGSEFETYC